jgi:hypothetical protein
MYSDAVQRLYVAYFNRPADGAGLAYWEGVVTAAGGNTSAVSAAFAGSDEYKRAYAGLNEAQTVQRVYQNLFGHDPDLAGLQYWKDALVHKQITVDNMVTQIAGGAQGTDKIAFDSKAAAAAAFTGALKTVALVLSYSGDIANMIGKIFVASVVDNASLGAAIAPDSLQKVLDSLGDNVVTALPANLTAGADRLSGTAGSDMFNAYAFDTTTGAAVSTMSDTDFIDGGPGKDALNIEISSGHNKEFGIIINVETINITEDAPTAIDASAFSGATLVRQIGNAGAISNLGSGVVAGFSGVTITGALAVSASGTSAAVSLDRVRDSASLAVSGSALQSVSVTGTRTHFGDGAPAALPLQVTAGSSVETLSVNTDQRTVLTVLGTPKLSSVDASASSGAITFDASAMPGMHTIKTGTGNDVVLAQKLAGQPLSVLTGDGDDTVMITGRLASGDVIDGGNGSNTLVITSSFPNAGNDPILNTVVKNFSTLKFIDTSTRAGLDATQLDHNFTTISLDSGSAVVGVTSQTIVAHGLLTATSSGYVAGTSYGGRLNITETASGTITANADSLNLAVKAGVANVTATVEGDFNAASVTLTNAVDDPADPHHDYIAGVSITTSASGLASLASLTLAGDGSATVVNADGTSLAIVDASALGGTLHSSTGPTQALTYSTSNSKAETIKLGAGIDHIYISGSTFDSMDTITGLKLVLNSAGTALAAGVDHLEVAGVTAPATTFITTANTLGLALVQAAASAKGDTLVFAFGGDTYIFHDNNPGNALDGDDILVKLVGTYDLKAVALALGGSLT